MASFYYYKNENSSVANLNCYNWLNINSRIHFDELICKKEGSIYCLFVNAQVVTDCIDSKNKDWDFQPNTKVCIKLNSQPYERVDYRTKEKETVRPSTVEKVLIHLLEKRKYESFFFKGFISLADSPILEAIINGKDVGGNVLSPALLESYEGMLWNVQAVPIAEAKILKPEDLIIKEKAANGNFKKFPSITEKLDEKLLFIKREVERIFPAITIQGFADITEVGLERQATTDHIKKEAYKLILELQSWMPDK